MDNSLFSNKGILILLYFYYLVNVIFLIIYIFSFNAITLLKLEEP